LPAGVAAAWAPAGEPAHLGIGSAGQSRPVRIPMLGLPVLCLPAADKGDENRDYRC